MQAVRPYLLIFIIGAILGMSYDFIHVYFGVLHYTHPHFLGESFWVFAEFGLAALVFLLGMKMIVKRSGSFGKTNLIYCFYNGLLLLIGYLITGIFAGTDWLTLGLLMPS